MESIVYLDTHVVYWLYAEGDAADLGTVSRLAISNADELRISPMIHLELQYLFETGRTRVQPTPVLDELSGILGLKTCNAPFPAVVKVAETLEWTRDPFDRLIVAQAALYDAPLVSKDRSIRKNYSWAVW